MINLQLFESTPIRDPNIGTDDPIFADPGLTSICESGPLLFTAAQNSIKIVENYTIARQFKAYEDGFVITRIEWLSQPQLLCSVAEKQGSPVCVRLWDLSHPSFRTQCLISNGKNTHPLTAFAFVEDFSVLAVGFGNGSVILVRGDLVHDRGSRQRVIFQSSDPVTNLVFKDEWLLFVTTVSRILTLNTTGRNQGKPERLLDRHLGADIGCCDKMGDSLVVARDDGISFYDSLAKTSSVGLEMVKRRMKTLNNNNYILIVTPQASSFKVVIFDHINRLIAFTLVVPSSVTHLFNMFFLCADGMLYELAEKPLANQIEIAESRGMFPLAIKMAGGNPKLTSAIRNHYADFLYNKQDYQHAIEEYCKVDSINVNSVILKFRDTDKMSLLVTFLESLQNPEIDHATLLLCIYCKLKQTSTLMEYVEKGHRFNVETVISLCRECGFSTEAVEISKKLSQDSLVVDILLNDKKNSSEALQYLRTLSAEHLVVVLIEFLDPLMSHNPDETTQLLVDIFNGSIQSSYQPPRPQLVFSAFHSYPHHFKLFLEECVKASDVFGGDKNSLLVILYEVYLHLGMDGSDLANEIARSGNQNDKLDLLLVSHMENFHLGENVARDRPGFEIDLFRSCMARDDVDGSIAVLEQYGAKEWELYRLALGFFTSSKQVYKKVGVDKIQQVLKEIKRLNIMSPLDVVQTLSINSVATLGLIREYLVDYVSLERREIEQNTKLATSYREETASLQKDIDMLISEPVTLNQKPQCQSCGLKLDFPAVHFICHHSFHQRCIGEELKCPLCTSEIDEIEALRSARAEVSQRQDLFQASLNAADDRFRVMTNFIGRGALEGSAVCLDGEKVDH